MLRLVNVYKSYKFGKNKNLVLDNINLDFKKNELVFILGNSGSGKSSLLNIIGGLLEVDSGNIFLDNQDITKFNDNMLCFYRNNIIGFIYQDYHLVEYMSVIDNIKLGQTIKNNNNRVDDILKKLGIYSKRKMIVNKLSGGEKQRVAIARAIINDPDIILADEPTGALDSSNGITIMNILKEISKNKLVIVVSHDVVLANKYADRIINIKDGKIDYLPVVDDNVKFNKIRKKKISLGSIIKLSFKNLCLRKWRTLFTSLAISLGFISILLVLFLSKSFNMEISEMERDFVSIFPIQVYNGEFENLNEYEDSNHINNKIVRKDKNKYIHTNKITNDYLTYIKDIKEINYISYDYDISLPVISDRYKLLDNKYLKVVPSSKFIDDNYKILYGNNISSDNDILLKLDSNNQVDSELLDIFNISFDIEYGELIGRKLKIILNDDYYVKNNDYYYVNTNLEEMYKKSYIELTIVGIIKEDDVVDNNNYLYYDNDLLDVIFNINKKSEIVLDQISKDYNVLGMNVDKDQLLSYLGYETLPSCINMYVSNIENKDILLEKLDEYNKKNNKLIYIDTIIDAINILRDVINIITIILIVFSLISIVVSSLMVFILTNQRVLERTKEIGILRGLGARKRDIVKLFNIENLIIGIMSSIIGIVIINVISKPINSLLGILLDDGSIFHIYNNILFLCVIFNVLIVIISGYIPTKIASKKRIVDIIQARN